MAQPQILDFRLIAADFRGIRVAAGNLVERQRHQRLEPIPGAAQLLQGLYRATANTLQAALFLCEERESDLTRERRFAVAVPPLVRVIADALFTVVFAFDDLPKNVRWFWSSGWHNSEANLRRMEERHAGDAEWRDQLLKHRMVQDDRRARWGIDLPERQGPKVPKQWWPNPGAMRKYLKDDERRAFLTHLHDWSYGRLSSSFLAFVSEFDSELGLGLAARLQYLWLVIGEYAWWTEDLYKLRYRALLAVEGEA